VDWLKRIRNATGRNETTAAEVMERLKRYVTLRRHHASRFDGGLLAMTVHQAKNREFDGVVVMWPYTVKADDEGKRRLLYNAVTRARRWCTVIVQSPDMLKAAPFA
jgi:DNA helicase IV